METNIHATVYELTSEDGILITSVMHRIKDRKEVPHPTFFLLKEDL